MATLLSITGNLLSKPFPRLIAFLLLIVLIVIVYHHGASTMPATNDFYLPYIGIIPGELINDGLPGIVYIGGFVAFFAIVALEVDYRELRKLGINGL